MVTTNEKRPFLPPRWFIRTAWVVHRGIFRASGGRLGLSKPTASKYGMFRLHTIGRRSGKEHNVILGYFEDGPNVVTMAMNGWGEGHPAWWLNLRANPDTTIDLVDGSRPVRGRAAQGEEHDRLWDRWKHYDKNLDGFATLRSTRTAVVILEPRSESPAN
jgi:deazaflavin-dependent oxidoreductase (nitroreductase family)